VNAKSDRNAKTEARGGDRLERGGGGGKSEQYTIDTSNILFVFAGAFVGLDRIVAARMASGTSIGFGASLKSSLPSTSSKKEITDPLQNITPTDLQAYGLIPELLGRIPILTSLHPLTLEQLVSILTLPKNSLVKQYTALFQTYGIQLKFSTAALHAIAEKALDDTGGTGKPSNHKGGGIGARGLRSIMESVLGEVMFWGPGSSIRFCLIDEKFVRGFDEGSSQFKTKKEGVVKEGEGGKAMMPKCWSRGQGRLFEEAYEKEEETWKAKEEERERKERGEEDLGSFERYRVVGSSGM
jgi:ATP-dependent Clp protease ATP-binding subunit ClpX